MEQSKFYQIKNITEQEYTLVGCDGSVVTRPIQDVDKLASAFTIQDAKDGDVLADNGAKIIFIFKNIEYDSHIESNVIKYFIRYSFDGINLPLENGGHLGVVGEYSNFVPATKEQRDTLEKAMTDAGYTFDFEKKELKKIEKKHAWSIEDERIFSYINLYIRKAGNYPHFSKENIKEAINWLKSLKDRVQPQPKQEWSEEDNQYLYGLIGLIEQSKAELPITLKGKAADNCIDWLKSLRPQSLWKPSESDILLLERIANGMSNPQDFQASLSGLIGQLKKLKG